MQFIADVHLVCEECKGNRFKQEILDIILFINKNISQILDLTVSEAYYFSKKTMKKKYQKDSTIARCWFRIYKVRSIFFHFKWWRSSENKT